MMNIKIDKRNKTVDLYGMGGYTKRDPYWITWERLVTVKQLIEWVDHLSQKVWWSESLRWELTHAWEEINGLTCNGRCEEMIRIHKKNGR